MTKFNFVFLLLGSFLLIDQRHCILVSAKVTQKSFLQAKLSGTTADRRLGVRGNVQLEAAAATSSEGGEATIATSTFNLAKSIIGAGVLSLPSALAFFSDEKAVLLPGGLLIVVMGLLSAYTFSLIGQACAQHKVKSYQEAYAKSVDPSTAWIISFGTTCKCALACLAYSIIIGDSFSAMAKTFQLPALLQQRNNVIMTIAASVLFPLCSMKSLNALAPFSLLGLGGTLFTAVFMAIRLHEKSYAVGGKFFNTLTEATRPVFATKAMKASPLIFVLLSMLSTSFIAHYNAPRFLTELKNPTMKRYNSVVANAFVMSIAVYLFVTIVGFLTFGGNSLGFILNNYSGTDSLATLARLAIGATMLTGYPFTFTALKDGLMDLIKVPTEKRAALIPAYNVGLLTLITGAALLLKDVGFVVSLSGALFGAALMFIAPGLMQINNIRSIAKSEGVAVSGGKKFEIAANYGLVGMGVVLTMVGVTVSILKQMKML